MTSDTYQEMMVKDDGLLPNNTSALDGIAKITPSLKEFLLAVAKSNETTASPDWAIVEGQTQINYLLQDITEAKSDAAIKNIANHYDCYFNQVLNELP